MENLGLSVAAIHFVSDFMVLVIQLIDIATLFIASFEVLNPDHQMAALALAFLLLSYTTSNLILSPKALMAQS